MRAFFRFLTTPFRWMPWYLWLALAGIAAWFGRGILIIIATIIAFHPIPVPPLFQGEAETVEEARLQDLRHFRHVRRNDRSMTEAMRAEFDARTAELREGAGELSDAEFMLGLARAQAVIDNGHSNTSAVRLVRDFPRLPVRSAFMDGELRILRVRGSNTDLLGARILTVDGEPVEAAIARFRDVFGGNDAYFRSVVPLLLETPAMLTAVGLGNDDAVVLDLELADGRRDRRTLRAFAAGESASPVYPGSLAMAWRLDGDEWQAVLPAGEPLFLRHPDRGYWFERVGQSDIVYLTIRRNLDDDSGESIRAFSERAAAELRAISPRAIIVDQRFNGGGDLTLTFDLMDQLGDIVGPEGRVYLLANANTFSAAIVNLAAAKAGAPQRTVIVGSQIGDRLQFWAEGWAYTLPNSGFYARYSTGFYDLQNGCSGIFRCHWGSRHIFPILVDDLDVDIPAPLDFEAYVAGRDPAVEAVLAAEAVR